MTNNFHENLKKIRESRKISQSSIAEKIGVSQPAVVKWEDPIKRGYPLTDKLIKVIDILDVSAASILFKTSATLIIIKADITEAVRKECQAIKLAFAQEKPKDIMKAQAIRKMEEELSGKILSEFELSRQQYDVYLGIRELCGENSDKTILEFLKTSVPEQYRVKIGKYYYLEKLERYKNQIESGDMTATIPDYKIFS